MKAIGGGTRDALESLDTFQAATFRSAVGLVGCMVLDRPDCQHAAKAVRSATIEARLDAHDASWPSSRWHTTNSNGSTTRRTYRRNMRCIEIQNGQARKREGAQLEHSNGSDSTQSSSAAQLSMSSLSRAERLSCTPHAVQQLEGCGQCSR